MVVDGSSSLNSETGCDEVVVSDVVVVVVVEVVVALVVVVGSIGGRLIGYRIAPLILLSKKGNNVSGLIVFGKIIGFAVDGKDVVVGKLVVV